MIRCLPDVNAHLALVRLRHESHASARGRLGKPGHRARATNPLTQLGVLRPLTNPALTHGAVTSATAVEILGSITRHDGHEFRPLDRNMISGLRALAGKLRGRRQWTGPVLLWQARGRDGVLATFGSAVKVLAAGEARGHVLVLKRG